MGDRVVSWKKWTSAFFSAKWIEYEKRSFPSYSHNRRTNSIKKLLDGRGLVLDVGSGAGQTLTDLVSDGGFSGVGLDLSKSLVKAAQNLARERTVIDTIYFILGDAEELPFRDDCFDTVYCAGTIEHLPRPARGIAEMGRVTKHMKQVIIVTPNTVHGISEKLQGFFHSTITSKFLVNELRRNRFRVIYWDCFLLVFPFCQKVDPHVSLEKFEQKLPRILRMILLADIAVVGVKNA